MPNPPLPSSPRSPLSPLSKLLQFTFGSPERTFQHSLDDSESKFQGLVEQRSQIYHEAIMLSELNIQQIQMLAFQGIPDDKGLRAIYWKIMLGYLPLESRSWKSKLAKMRDNYFQLVAEFLPEQLPEDNQEISEDCGDTEIRNGIKWHSVTPQEDPLGEKFDFEFQVFSEKNRLLKEIEIDVLRTHSQINFFSSSVENSFIGTKNQRHQHVLTRILYIYCNEGSTRKHYIQGMNEPIDYIFVTSWLISSLEFAEADTFFCFYNLMQEIGDRFALPNPSQDRFSSIFIYIDQFQYILRQYDNELCEHLDQHRVDPKFYAFRWLTLLLSQEFSLPDTIRIWDSLLADPTRFNFLPCLCCAMLIAIRHNLMTSSFSGMMQILQNYPAPDNVQDLLDLAVQIRVSVKTGYRTNARTK